MWNRNIPAYAFGLALLCFCLPWIEIRCDAPRGGLFSGQGNDVIITSQSGLQMTYGGVSTSVNHMPLTPQQRAELERQKGNRNLAAPAMILYALCLLAGLGVSLTFRDPHRRFLFTSGASLVAVAILIVQLAYGFPLVENVPRRQNGNGWSYTIVFWLGLISTFAALLTAVARRFALQANSAELSAEETAAAHEPSVPLQRGVDDFLIAWLAKLRSPRVIRGAMIFAASMPFILFALYAWPGFLRPLPQAGIAMSGFVEYMISDEHIAAVKLGMTLEEVATALDIAQEKMDPPAYIGDKEKWRKEQKETGKNNVNLIAFSLQHVAQQKEFWFNFSATYRTLSVRILDGKVVEIKDSKDIGA
jgi:hypothetical protein